MTYILDSTYDLDWLDWESPKPPPIPDKKSCEHQWKSVVLIYTTVYDCIKCGVKKEDK